VELEALWEHLGGVARRLQVELRIERLTIDAESKEPSRGGLCLLRGRRVLLVDERAPLRDRIATVAAALSRFDLEGIHLPPLVRATIERGGKMQARHPAREASRVPPPAGSTWVRIGVAVAANDGPIA
jgi:hypothetical protein